MTGPDAPAALRATGLGFRYRARGGWALRDCEFTVPCGRVTAIVGRNGVGKSTLLHLAGGLLRARRGELRVLDVVPGTPEARARVALLTQDKPLYPRFTVADTLLMGEKLNTSWDRAAAENTVREGDIPLTARVGELSPGQRTRVALALALGKRPELLLLDEPMADLDPVARGEIMATLMTEAADHGTSIVLSSHVLPELETTCDWVLLLRNGRVELSEDADALRESHAVLTGHADQEELLTGPADRASLPTGPAGRTDTPAGRHTVVHRRVGVRQMTALVRQRGPLRGDWHVERPSLENILIGYLQAADPQGPALAERTEAAA
ncbi:ABC transporter ATP-binding protein [Streptomyces phaeofaciens JCM 4814]|uniref:ABC transporter ATP-binding protein n=1 Tax=Streptomyces phaeofaciens TaxID=68254 RepID=A0A918HL42_9ACTN|nr:ABC transporter ATP-binding protein [Streptomyces phaeofaciens]GGT75734.1 ABC transporter ATP-binding protein [Streptomyces phaeofaciens]